MSDDQDEHIHDLRREYLKNQRESNRSVGKKVGRFIAGALTGAVTAGIPSAVFAPTNELAVLLTVFGSITGGVIAMRENEQQSADKGQQTSKQDQVAARMRTEADAAARGEKLPPTPQQLKEQARIRAELEKIRRELGQ